MTSPFANSVFILSKKPDSSTLDSSIINTIFSSLQPDLLSTVLRSSSKSAAEYLLCTCVWGRRRGRERRGEGEGKREGKGDEKKGGKKEEEEEKEGEGGRQRARNVTNDIITQ